MFCYACPLHAHSMHMLDWFAICCGSVCFVVADVALVIHNHALITVTFECAKTTATETSAMFSVSQTVYTGYMAPSPNSHLLQENCSTFAIRMSLLIHGVRIRIPLYLREEMLNLINTITCSWQLLFAIIMWVHLGFEVISILC